MKQWLSIFSEFFRLLKPKVDAPIIIIKLKEMAKPIITAEQLTRISPANKGMIAFNRAAALSKICVLYKIDSITVFEDFLANVLHESGEMNRVVESMNYSVIGLINGFGRHRISVADANKYGRIDNKQVANQKMIGNLLYGGQWGLTNLGNKIGSTDGWDFRGTSFLQITGRYLGEGFTKYVNKLLGTNYTIYETFEKLRKIEEIEFGVHCACWVFAVEKGLVDEAISNQVVLIRKKINGGNKGLKEVQDLTLKIRGVLQ